MAMSVFESETSLIRMIESLLAKLTSSAIQQASLHIGVSQHLHQFNHTLLSFKLILFDYYKPDDDSELQEWRKMLKQLFNSVEIMVDEILCQALERKKAIHDGTSSITKVCRFFSSFSNPIVFRLRTTLATQISAITKRLQLLLLSTARTIHLHTRLLHRRVDTASPYVNESDVIGRDIDKEIIIHKLLMEQQHDDDDQSLSVLPIVGMGGLGKTTLAQIVFGDQRIRKSFSVRMWVCASHDFDIEQVIIDMINPAYPVDSSFGAIKKGQFDMIQLVRRLENKLVVEKFLLVLDNVQNGDSLKWDALRNLIPTGAKGSKILLTTRNHSIASMTGTIPSHNLECLSQKDSLSLFEKCDIDEEAKKYQSLMEIGREIVKHCEGIPSAIITMGRMLFSKHERVQLDSRRDSELSDLSKKYGILPAFRLSYEYIPFHLKQCFELFALYPNDFVFHSSEVVSLWAALDLLPSPNADENLTDVALRCLRQLIPRFFLKDFVNFGTSFYFQIHDLVHALARDMANYECLMVNSNYHKIPENVRYLSFGENNLFDKSFTPKYVNVRIILFPIEGVGATNQDFLNMCLSKYKYLRILDLSDSTYEFLPRSISKLRYLRFLSLERNKKIKRVPNSVCKLQNLQVLNVAGCIELEKLPEGLRNLTSLRQLGITTKESTLPENDIASFDSLEILNIDSCEKLESFCVGIKFPALKTLEVANCGRLKYVPLDIDHFPRLETLLVDNCGYLELTKRHDDQNSTLQLKAISFHSLPQLVNLPCWLQKSTNTLQSLLIVDCKNLEMLPEWLSTLSFLVSIGMVNCPKLKSLPNHIDHLIALEYLRIEECPELSRKLQPQIGEYWSIISHIKQVFIDKTEDLEEEQVLEED